MHAAEQPRSPPLLTREIIASWPSPFERTPSHAGFAAIPQRHLPSQPATDQPRRSIRRAAGSQGVRSLARARGAKTRPSIRARSSGGEQDRSRRNGTFPCNNSTSDPRWKPNQPIHIRVFAKPCSASRESRGVARDGCSRKCCPAQAALVLHI